MAALLPDTDLNVLDDLERVAQYQGPWNALRADRSLLQARIDELRDRERRGGDVLVVALVGGSGVGKSTLLNALAGDENLAQTSAMRPCTSIPTVYHPQGVTSRFEGWRHVAGSTLDHLVLVDTPDSDTIVREHRAQVVEVLKQCDLILLCASSEKYLDEASWSLLRPLIGERQIVCIETKYYGNDSIKPHWITRLREQGFQIVDYFRVDSLHSLHRKLRVDPEEEEEFDFPRLERFLREELSAERIARIKRSNAAGMMIKTVQHLQRQMRESTAVLENLEERVEKAEKELARASVDVVSERLFTESHLWLFVLGREIGLRAKGISGSLYRFSEAVRNLPARLSGWIPWAPRSTGQRAASLLSSKELFHEDLEVATAELSEFFRAKQSELAVSFSKAGFDAPTAEIGLEQFREALDTCVSEILRGPARDMVIRQARTVTSWPATLLADLLPLSFLIYASVIIVGGYFTSGPLEGGFLTHTLVVLVIILGAEMVVLSLITRSLAWNARRHALHMLRVSLVARLRAFESERALLVDAQQLRETVDRLHAMLG